MECCGDDPQPTPANESMDSMLQAYIKNAPGLSKATTEQVLPIEQALMDARKTISPQQAQLQTDLYKQFGPIINEIGSAIAKQNALAQAATDRDVLQGPGLDVVKAGLEASKIADPEFYAQRAAISDKLGALLQGIDPSGLSGSERAEVERSLARDAGARGISSPTSTETIANAMQFGNALGAKQQRIAGILGGAMQSLPSMRSGVDPFAQATGRSGTANTGDARLSGPIQVGNQAFDQANNFMGNFTSLANNFNSNKMQQKSGLDKIGQATGILSNLCG